MRTQLTFGLVLIVWANGCRRPGPAPAPSTTASVPDTGPAAAPVTKDVEIVFGIYLARREVRTTVSPTGLFRSVETGNKSYHPNDRAIEEVEIRQGQLSPAQLDQLRLLFAGWRVMPDSYPGVPDGPESVTRYGDKKVNGYDRSGRVSAVHAWVRRVRDAMPVVDR